MDALSGGFDMQSQMGARLVEWISRKASAQYAGDIALVMIYGSQVNGTAHARSDVDCYFIPKRQRAYGFARTFIIDGIGYDIFPVTWERAQGMADLQESLMPLIGDSVPVYCDARADMERFEGLQARLRRNLADPQRAHAAACARIASAGAMLSAARRAADVSELRMNASYAAVTLADAVALNGHTYYHCGLKRQYADLCALPGIPGSICAGYREVLLARAADAALERCDALLDDVCAYLGEQLPAEQPADGASAEAAPPARPDCGALAALYEEICSTFNKIYASCEAGDALLACISAASLQYELDCAHAESGARRYSLFDAYDPTELESWSMAVRAVERDFERFIVEGGGHIRRFGTFEEFAAAMD